MSTGLENKLQTILEEKKSKIIPENIKQGVQIFDIVGNYNGTNTTDATATSDDVINPKVVYVQGEKIIGSIMPIYSTKGYLTVKETINNNSISVNDINLTTNIAVSYDGTTLNVYKIVDGAFDVANVKSYVNTDINITEAKSWQNTKLAPDINADNTIGLVIVTARSGVANAPFYIHLYKIDINTLEVTEQAVNTTAIVTSADNHWIASYTTNIQIAFSTNTKFLIVSGRCNDGGSGAWEFYNLRLSYAYMEITENGTGLAIIKNGYTASLNKETYNDSWDGAYPQVRMIHVNGYFCCYIAKNYLGGGRDSISNLLYLSVFLRDDDLSIIIKKGSTSSNHIYVVCGDYIIGNNTVYDLYNPNTVIDTCSFNPVWGNIVTSIGNSLVLCNSAGTNIYNIDDEGRVTHSTTLANVYGQIESSNMLYIAITNPYITVLHTDKILSSFTRKAIDYYNTSDATILRENVLAGKYAYNSNGKLKGTMPNNGALEITPTKDSQTLPAGYISGGTVNGDLNLLPANIRADKTIFGVVGLAPITFSTVEELNARIDFPEDTYAIVYGTSYVGTFRLDKGTWTQIGDSTEEQKIMDTLNQVVGTVEQYEGNGGTDEEISKTLDNIIGNGGNI